MTSRPLVRQRVPYMISGLAASLLVGCASTMQGTFEPACIAYEGDRVALSEGRFEWQRFTDAVAVDQDGNRIDPFPGYPKTGRFEQDGERLSWDADDGSTIDERYLLEHRGRTYLLTWDQNEAVLDGEEMPACALVLVDDKR